MANIHENSMQKLDELRERILLTVKETHDTVLLSIADDLMEIKKTFLEEEKTSLEKNRETRKLGGIITSDNVEELDNGFGNTRR